MSNDRDDEMLDQEVSKNYREHATERAPEHLNAKILKMAADEVRESRRFSSLFDSWTRPLALAATVVLSFAIVLEVTRDPGIVVPVATVPESLQNEFEPKDTSALDDARNQARLRAGSNQTGDLELKRDRDDSPALNPQSQPEPAAASRQAAAQSGFSPLSPSAEKSEPAVEQGCDDRLRETAERWLLCIKALRDAGAEELAEREYEQFVLQFPDE